MSRGGCHEEGFFQHHLRGDSFRRAYGRVYGADGRGHRKQKG